PVRIRFLKIGSESITLKKHWWLSKVTFASKQNYYETIVNCLARLFLLFAVRGRERHTPRTGPTGVSKRGFGQRRMSAFDRGIASACRAARLFGLFGRIAKHPCTTRFQSHQQIQHL